MAHFTRQPCELADRWPDKPCDHGDWRIVWVETGPILHDVKMAPFTYVGRYGCRKHEELHWKALYAALGTRSEAKAKEAKEAKEAKGDTDTMPALF